MGKGGKGKRRRRIVEEEEESKKKSEGQHLSGERLFKQNKICRHNFLNSDTI